MDSENILTNLLKLYGFREHLNVIKLTNDSENLLKLYGFREHLNVIREHLNVTY